MSRTFESGGSISRRDVLRSALAAGAIGTASGAGFTGAAAGHEDPSGLEVTVRQNGERLGCVTPLTYHEEDGSPMAVADFYNYHSGESPGGSNTPVDLEATNESRLFFFEDADGVSLVFVHDDYDPSAGTGRDEEKFAKFTFGGLPTGSGQGWLAIEQSREGEDSYGATAANWRWTPRYADGGAYGYLTCDFDVTLSASFTQEGTDASWLETDGWLLLSGDVEDPDAITLDPSEPVRLTCGCCTTCAEGDLLAKYEWDEEAAAFVPEYEASDGAFELTVEKTDHGAPTSVTVDADYCEYHAVVKAGRELDCQSVPELTGIEYENPGGKRNLHAISYVALYCGPKPDECEPEHVRV